MDQSTNPQSNLNAQLEKIHRNEEEEAAKEKAKKLGLQYIDIGRAPINIDLLRIIEKEDAVRGLILPFFRVGKKLRVAVFEPEKPETQEVIESLRANDYKLNINIASKTGILETTEQYNTRLLKQTEEVKNVFDEDLIEAYEAEITKLNELKNSIGSMTPKSGLNSILVGAIRTGASDIHIEPYKKIVKIRFRIDGVLQDILEFDAKEMVNVINHLKHEAHIKLNVSEKPQDGRLQFKINERGIDVRLSTLPTIHGESIVMRLLDNDRRVFKLEELGLTGRQLESVKRAVASPNGMILTTGPTGSGKTTTLYSILNILNNGSNKIITLEDPVEYHVFGITQSQISTEKEYTFAKGLRAILRQDPDIVMVGEIRDIQTAEIASQAALTGHIVLSTLHTNNAVGAIARLNNMGLPPYMVAPSISCVMAQRLARKLCTKCKKEVQLQDKEREMLIELAKSYEQIIGTHIDIPATIFEAQGCDACSHTGFHGQIGLFEVCMISDDLREAILDEKAQFELQNIARKNGMITLREDGMHKVVQGITSFSELMRVTADNS